MLNMAVHAVGGVLFNPLGCLGWGYGRKSEVDEGYFLVILDVSWKIALILDFSTMCYGEKALKEVFFWIYLVSLV